jgi:hypothetical protein
MFLLTLFTSVPVFGLAHVAATRYPRPIRWMPFVFVSPAVLFFCSCMFVPTVSWILFGILSAALVVWAVYRQRIRHFAFLSIPSVLIAYGVCVEISRQAADELDQLKQEFPLESMDNRVPEPTWTHPADRTDFFSVDRVDHAVTEAVRPDRRKYSLERLHDRTVDRFTSAMGFGNGRMAQFAPTTRNAISVRRDEIRPVQPGHTSASDEWVGPLATIVGSNVLTDLHEAGLVNFVNPTGFGFVKDRKWVIGFIPHAFSEVPGPAAEWEVQTLELVGLLIHPEPAVYVSTRLPAMDELKDAPTRKPDTFEAAALNLVRNGSDLVTGTTMEGTRMRMLGAIRNGTTCQKCHGGDRGDLLGAFSYVLSRK